MYGARGSASSRISDGRIRLQSPRPHLGAQSGPLGLHGEPHPFQFRKSRVGSARPQHDSARRCVLPEFPSADARALPQARHAGHRRHDRSVSQPRRQGTKRTGSHRPRSRQKERSRGIDGRRMDRAPRPESNRRGSVPFPESAFGTRAAVRTVIRYRNGVLSGRGASLLDGYMEDLATDRIYRLMIAQRIKHRDKVKIVDENGTAVPHTPEFVSQLFDEELQRILKELPAGTPAETTERFRRARILSERLIVNGEFNPV